MIDLKRYINILKKYKKYSIDINAEGPFLSYFYIDKDSDWKDIAENLEYILEKHKGKIVRITLKEIAKLKELNKLTQQTIKVINVNIKNYKKLDKILNEVAVEMAMREI
jgi:hypothetical protein